MQFLALVGQRILEVLHRGVEVALLLPDQILLKLGLERLERLFVAGAVGLLVSLVPLDGRNHLPFENEPAWATFVREVRVLLGAPAA